MFFKNIFTNFCNRDNSPSIEVKGSNNNININQNYISKFKDKLQIYTANPQDNTKFDECEAVFQSACKENPDDQDVMEFPDLALKYFNEFFPLIQKTGYHERQQDKIKYYTALIEKNKK